MFQIFGYLGLAAASLLIVLRVYVPLCPFSGQVPTESSSIAIWNKNKIVMATAAILWVTNIVIMTQGKPSSPSPID